MKLSFLLAVVVFPLLCSCGSQNKASSEEMILGSNWGDSREATAAKASERGFSESSREENNRRVSYEGDVYGYHSDIAFVYSKDNKLEKIWLNSSAGAETKINQEEMSIGDQINAQEQQKKELWAPLIDKCVLFRDKMKEKYGEYSTVRDITGLKSYDKSNSILATDVFFIKVGQYEWKMDRSNIEVACWIRLEDAGKDMEANVYVTYQKPTKDAEF